MALALGLAGWQNALFLECRALLLDWSWSGTGSERPVLA